MDLLPQVSFGILLALSLRPRHGYEIIKQVNEDSQGKIKLGAGTLYGVIDKLREQKYIAEVKVDASSRRRYYALTDTGRNRLQAELDYFNHAVAIAKERSAKPYAEIRSQYA
jgi:DNA-binding PadR family transcriptional regulator